MEQGARGMRLMTILGRASFFFDGAESRRTDVIGSRLILNDVDSDASLTYSKMQPSKTTMSAATVEEEFTAPHKYVGETPLLDPKVEEEGCKAIFNALTEDEKLHLADEHMPLRHLRAEKGDVEKAIFKIKDTIQWRQDFEVEKIKTCFEPQGDAEMRAIIAKENESGKVYCRGYDHHGRVVMYMRPARENTNDEVNQMRHLVYNLERAIACTAHKSGLEKINLFIDYRGFRLRDSPPMSTSKHTLDILQKHYPERMYRAYLCNPPYIFKAFYTLIKPFVDPTTKEKICFCNGKEGLETLQENFDLNTTEECAGGTGNLKEFDSFEYFSKPFHLAFDD